ncbi:VOC family protein [Streptomyces sp. NPDC051940]|uniref:VOC family protein n=1 Tax=Streptomyces sp. NPDC051940 TaxID=3155675 RepID=UPI0034252F55
MVSFAEGAPCWADVMVGDLEAGKRFYGELFGWTYGPPAPPEFHGYTEAYLDGEKVAALAAKPDGRMPTVWNIYFAAPDAAAAVRRITEAGGRLVMGPMRIGEFGTMAMAADPGGSVFGIWQPAGDVGFGRQDEPGAYCWVENHTREPESVDAFYEEVFGFVGAPMPDDPEARLWSLHGEEPGVKTAVAARVVLGEPFPVEMPPHFLLYFRVADADAAAGTARRLGGRVHLEPRDSPYGRWAILADNQGARFAVLAPPRNPEAASGVSPARAKFESLGKAPAAG